MSLRRCSLFQFQVVVARCRRRCCPLPSFVSISPCYVIRNPMCQVALAGPSDKNSLKEGLTTDRGEKEGKEEGEGRRCCIKDDEAEARPKGRLEKEYFLLVLTASCWVFRPSSLCEVVSAVRESPLPRVSSSLSHNKRGV
jgi:hypothetical protein